MGIEYITDIYKRSGTYGKRYSRVPVSPDVSKREKKSFILNENSYLQAPIYGIDHPGKYEGFFLIGKSSRTDQLHQACVVVPMRLDSKHFPELNETLQAFQESSEESGIIYEEAFFTGVEITVDSEEPSLYKVAPINTQDYDHDVVIEHLKLIFEKNGYEFKQ